MNKVRKTLVVVFGALSVLCMALFAAGCSGTRDTAGTSGSAYFVSVGVNDPSLGKYTLTEANSGDAYAEGTAVTVTVEPEEDYVAFLVVNGEEVTLTDNSYTFAIEEDTDVEVEFKTKEAALARNVSVLYSNFYFGSAELSGATPSGEKNSYTAEEGAELTLKVNPNPGYEVSYVTVNGVKTAPSGERTYPVTVNGDTEIFVCFTMTERFIVRVEMYGLPVTATLQIDEGTPAGPLEGDEFIKAKCYEGQKATVIATVEELADGRQLYYYENGGGRTLFTGEPIVIENIAADVTIRFAAEKPTAPTLNEIKTAVTNDEGAEIEVSYANAAAFEFKDGKWILMLTAPAAPEGFIFGSWTVSADGAPVEANGDGTYTFDYKEEGTVVDVTANWLATVTVTAGRSENGRITLSDGPYIKGGSVTVTVAPSEGYRVKAIVVTVEGSDPVSVPFNAVGEQSHTFMATGNAVITAEYQQIFTYTYDKPENASFAITAAEGGFLAFDEASSAYTLDEGGTYTVTFTADEGYLFTAVTVGGVPAEATEEGKYIWTGVLTQATEISAAAAKAVTVTYTVTPEGYAQYVTVTCNGAPVASGNSFAEGTKISVEITAPAGYQAKVTGLVAEEKTATDGAPVREEVILTADGLHFTVTYELLPAQLGVTFPENGNAENSKNLPEQGTWTSGAGENGDTPTLEIGANTMYVNGEPVTKFEENEDGSFALTTGDAEGNEKHYTLAWFGEDAEGYILALTDTTGLPARARRAAAAGEGADTAYYVNSRYGESYFDLYKDGDKETLVGKAWENGENTLTFTEVNGAAHVSLNETPATYVFAVAEKHYLFVIGAAAYDMTVGEGFITVNGDTYTVPETFQVTVTENGEAGDCNYALTNDGAEVQSGAYVAANTQLTLTLTLAEGYTAEVKVNEQPASPAEGQENAYTITVTAATSIEITYTYTAPAPEKAITKVSSARLADGQLFFTVEATGYTADELKTALKLVCGGQKELEPVGVEAAEPAANTFTVHFNSIVDLPVSADGYTLTLTIGEAPVELDLTVGAETGNTITVNENDFSLEVHEGTLTLKVTAHAAPAEYTVTVTESGKPGEGAENFKYTLTNGGAEVTSGSTVPASAALTLTVTVPEGYKAEVAVVGGTLNPVSEKENEYTISNLTGNVTITITYTATSVEPEPDKVITEVYNPFLDPAILSVWIKGENLTQEYLQGFQLLTNGTVFKNAPDEIQSDSSGAFKLLFKGMDALQGSDEGIHYEIEFQFGGQKWSPTAENMGAPHELAGKKFEVSNEGERLIIIVTNKTVDPDVSGSLTSTDAANAPEGWSFYDGGQGVKATEKDNVITVEFTDEQNAANWWSIQLYYKDTTNFPIGTKYTLTFDIASTVAGKIQLFEDKDWTQVIEFTQDGLSKHITVNSATVDENGLIFKLFFGVKEGETKMPAATITVSNLQVTKDTGNLSEQLSEGGTLTYEATVTQIGGETQDGIVARLNIGNSGLYIEFRADGLGIKSDEGTETFQQSQGNKTFNSAEYTIGLSAFSSPELLSAKGQGVTFKIEFTYTGGVITCIYSIGEASYTATVSGVGSQSFSVEFIQRNCTADNPSINPSKQ